MHNVSALRQGVVPTPNAPHLVMGGEQVAAFVQHLRPGATVEVVFYENAKPEGLYHLTDVIGLKFDDVTYRRITAVRSSKDQTRMQPRSFCFTVLDHFMDGGKQKFIFKLGPLLEELRIIKPHQE